MRYLILSDIHEDFQAFNAVLERVSPLGWDKMYFLGDVVGHRPATSRKEEVLKCIDLLRQHDAQCILGNWEGWLLGEVGMREQTNYQQTSATYREYRQDFDELIALLQNTDILGWMSTWAETIALDEPTVSIEFWHGSPIPEGDFKTWETYLKFDNLRLRDLIFNQYVNAEPAKKLILNGHTHQAGYFKLANRNRRAFTDNLAVNPNSIDLRYVFAINPGCILEQGGYALLLETEPTLQFRFL
ncbi:MAG TPA: metallophosphoesterase family protein [Anaerolineales bacterium]|nr:metallophosphoesterase family protein [Anaerolineales bacterium]